VFDNGLEWFQKVLGPLASYGEEGEVGFQPTLPTCSYARAMVTLTLG
jgi:hypothetical protein